jgi:hypothetical protein
MTVFRTALEATGGNNVEIVVAEETVCWRSGAASESR